MGDTINVSVRLPSPYPPCFELNLTEIPIYPYLTCVPSPPPISIIIPVHTRVRNSAHLSTLILVSISIFSSLLLIMLTLFAAINSRRCRRRRRRSSPSPMTEPTAPATEADHLDGGLIDEQPGDHHVWYIRTQGLDAETIATIPLLCYDPAERSVEGSDCAVCLGEFVAGDALRRLPRCGHAFHLSCIDTWLASHLNCPICRALVIPSKSNSFSATTSSASSSSSSVHPTSSDSGSSSSDPGSGQLSIELERTVFMSQGEISDSGSMNIKDSGVIIAQNSPRRSSVCGFPDNLEENGFSPVRRSASVDAVADYASIIHAELNGDLSEDTKEASILNESPCVDHMKQAGDGQTFIVLSKALIGRSLSSSGRWFNFAKRGRLAQSSVLPL